MINRLILPTKFSFPEVVKGLSDGSYNVLPLTFNLLDETVITLLQSTVKNMIKSKSGIRAKGKVRINDINDTVLDAILETLRSRNTKDLQADSIEKLAMNSYGDIKITYETDNATVGDNIYYLELVCTTKTDIKGDFLRCIYLSSNLKNITSNGKHILMLITFDLDEVKRIFYPKLLRQYDLYNANMNLKIEYSASLNDIDQLGIL